MTYLVFCLGMNEFLAKCRRVEPFMQHRSRKNLEDFLRFYISEKCTKKKQIEANVVEYGHYLQKKGLKCAWLKLKEILEIAEVSSWWVC